MSVKAIRVACVVMVLAVASMAQDGPPQGGGPGQGRRGQLMGTRGTFGEITEIKGDTLILQGRDGKSETVKVTDATTYWREGQEAKFADFKVGERVMVGGELKDGTWMANKVMSGRPGGQGGPGGRGMMNTEDMGKKFIAGEITKIEDTKLTVHRIDGQDQVIEVDETTSFRNRQRESITLADIKVGDKVMGRGEIKDGTFVPAMLNVGEFPQRFGGGPGGPRPDAQTQAPPKQ